MEELDYYVQKIKDGEIQYFEKLFSLLQSDLKKMSAQYFIAGADTEDVTQECRIGLWKAIDDYSKTGGMNFKNFAINICCKRHLITAVSHANRKKYAVHNSADSLDAPSSDGDDSNLADFIQDNKESILDRITEQQFFEEHKTILFDKLTKLELSILQHYLNGYSYNEIAEMIDVKQKTVDNALMRIRKKAQTLDEA